MKESQETFEENYLGSGSSWDANEPEAPIMVGTASNHANRMSTNNALSLGTSRPRTEEPIDRIFQPQNTILSQYLVLPRSTSFSLHSSGSRNHLSSERNLLQNHHEFVSVDGVDEGIISGASKKHLLKTFLEKSSSWVSQPSWQLTSMPTAFS